MKSDPYFLPGPGGVLNLKGCTFKAVNDSEVYVSGSKHEETPYSLNWKVRDGWASAV